VVYFLFAVLFYIVYLVFNLQFSSLLPCSPASTDRGRAGVVAGLDSDRHLLTPMPSRSLMTIGNLSDFITTEREERGF